MTSYPINKLRKDQMADMMKQMGKKWSSLPPKEKEMFNEAARHDKERFLTEMREFEIHGDKSKSIQDYDAQRPKKCLSSYMIFVRETRPKVAAELKQNSIKEEEASLNVMKIVGKRWKELDKERRKEFDDKAKEDKKRYEREMEEFNKEIDKVDIQTHDERRSKTSGLKISKHKPKRKHKKSIDNQAEYYYPVKNTTTKEKETTPPRTTYSLRKRNRSMKKQYIEKSEDEFEEDSLSGEDPKSKRQQTRKRTSGQEGLPTRPKRTKMQEIDDEEDKDYQMQNPMADSQRQPQGPQYGNKKQPFFGNDYNMMNPGGDSEYSFNQSIGRSKHDPITRRQSSNMMQVNMEPRPQTSQSTQNAQNISTANKRERRSKKYFDQGFRVQPEMDEYINPINSELLERRSGSNNRLGLNEDKGTEKSNKDSYMFPFQEEEENNSLNKDSNPENELRQINLNMPENEPDLAEDLNKMVSKDFSRQDSTKFMNYEPQGATDSFGPGTFQFKEGNTTDYNDAKFSSQQFNPQMNVGWTSFGPTNDYRNFPMNQQVTRMHQNSFSNNTNNLFEARNTNFPFSQEFTSNPMNSGNQYNDNMRGQMNFFNDTPARRNNSFAGPKR